MDLARALLEAIRDERDRLGRSGVWPDDRLSEVLGNIADEALRLTTEE